VTDSEEIRLPNIVAISIMANLDDPDAPITIDLGNTPAGVAYLWMSQACETLKFGTMNIEVRAHGETVIDGIHKGE